MLFRLCIGKATDQWGTLKLPEGSDTHKNDTCSDENTSTNRYIFEENGVKCSRKRLSLRRMEMAPVVSDWMENKDYLPSRQSKSTFPNAHDLFSMYSLHHPSSSDVPGSVSGHRHSVGSSMDLHCNWKLKGQFSMFFSVIDNWFIFYLSFIFSLCFCLFIF